MPVALTDRSGGVRRGHAAQLVRADTTSTWVTMLEGWRHGQPKGRGDMGLSVGKSSPTPRSPKKTLLNTLA